MSEAGTETGVAPDSRAVIRTFYTIAGLYTLAASVIWSVNTLFLLDAGLDLFEVFIANAAFSAGMVVFEIPTGVVADTLGRRVSFLLSVAVLGASTLAYVALAQMDAGLLAFCGVSVLMGLGFTFYSGAVEAWLVDALTTTGYEGELDPVFARSQMVTGVAMLVGTIGGGLLGQIDLSIPFVARALMLAALFAVAFGRMVDIGFRPRRVTLGEYPAEMGKVARAGLSFGWGQRPMRLLMVAAFFQSSVFMWAFYAWPPYLLDLLGRDAVWVAGFVSAGIAASTIAGNVLVDVFTRYCGNRTTLLIGAAATQVIAVVVVGLTDSFWVAVPFLWLITFGLGVSMPVRQSYIHHLLPSEQRATVVSFDSMVAGVGGTGGQVALGAVGEARGLSVAYVAAGAISVVALPILWALRRLRSPADRIVGVRDRAEGSCAAQGTPAIAQVSSETVEQVAA